MKKVASPRRLPHVLQAIEDLGDKHGSTTRRIMDQLENAHFSTTERPKNLTTEVRKALKYAIDNGLVKERGGRFAVSKFYGSSKKSDPNKSIFECRRRRKNVEEKRRRRRRQRRHASLSSLSGSEVPDEYESDRDLSYSRSRSRSPGYETTDGIISHRHRRKRGGSKQARRRRRGRKHDLHQMDDIASPRDDRRCLAHHLQDCDNPGCQKGGVYDEIDRDKHGSYIN